MLKWVYNVGKVLLRPIYYLKVIGQERVPEGGCIVCANHTAAVDSVLLIAAVGTHRFAAAAKAELFEHKLIARLLRRLGAFPIRRGQRDLSAMRHAVAALQDGQKLMIFPEGTRVQEGASVDAKTGAAMLASRAGVPIVPAYITAGKKAFRRCRVVFGTPIAPLAEKGHHAYHQMTDLVMDQIRELGKSGEPS